MYIKHAEAILAELNNILNGNGKFYLVMKKDCIIFNYFNHYNDDAICAVEFYENFVRFMGYLNHIFKFKFPLEDDYEKYIISITEKYNIKNYYYHMDKKSLYQTTITEKYNYPDFKIVFYGKDLFTIYDEQENLNSFINCDGVFIPLIYIPHGATEYIENIKKRIMVMDGKEDMRIELGDEIIQLTSGFRPQFID